ncbi:MAG TPA: hypothetical protein PLC65_00500 [Bacteroidia bacterium]|nr:hypothetical protein [Bacteroidia bacterium]
MKIIVKLTLVALLGQSLTTLAHEAPESNVFKKESKSFFKRKENKCVATLKAPITKFFNPPTYIRFVLKNRKGTFLNIKIGYIN